MTRTDTAKLDKLRRALLQLHKALLDAQRIRYERENGRVESRGELLALVLEDASFEWLRVLSALIARLDELADADKVDDKNEQAEGEDGDGQGQQHDERPDQRVDESEQQGRDKRGVEALHLHRGHEVGEGEQRERVDHPDEEEV